MIFRQLLDPDSSTWTYLLGDERTREAVLIDAVREQADRDLQLLRELGLRLVYVLDTHVHADHVTAAYVLRQRTGAKWVVSKRSGAKGIDVPVVHGDALRFGLQVLEVRATPGHTNGCVTYVLGDLSRAFTGDALLIRGCGRTDFQEGDPRTLFHSLYDQVFSLPDDTLLYPGHDYKGRTVTTVREEKLYNPRLANKTEDEFAAIMNGLGLAYPKKIDVAVPANLDGGQLPTDAAAPPAPSAAWAPIVRSATGSPQVDARWVAQHLADVTVVDVRQADEYAGALGHVEGSRHVPMDALELDAKGWDRDQSYVLVCRSGGRSDRAASVMEKLGFAKVASMTGGMVRWDELGLPKASPGDTAQG